MDIIQAWKAAKEDGFISRADNDSIVCLTKSGNISKKISGISNASLLADDWEVLKEKKVVEKEVFWITGEANYLYYSLAPGSLTGNYVSDLLPPNKLIKAVFTWEE